MSYYLYHSALDDRRREDPPNSLWNGRFECSDGPLANLKNRPCREIHELCRDNRANDPATSSRVAS